MSLKKKIAINTIQANGLGCNMIQDKDGYTLIHRYNGRELTLKFPIGVEKSYLSDALFEFLCGCGWDRECVRKIIKGGELYTEDEDETEEVD